MEDHIYAFIDFLSAQRRYAANTLIAYRNDLLQLCQFVQGERPGISSWSHVDNLLLQAFLLHLRSRDYSASSIARKVAACKSFYSFLVAKGFIVENVAHSLDAPSVPKRMPQSLTEQEVSLLLDSASDASPKGARDRAMFEVLYATGVRVTELVSLPLASFDAAAGVLRVGGATGRTIDLSTRAKEALGVYLDKARPALGGPDGGGPLFVNSRGTQLTRQGVWLILKDYCQRAGMDAQITPHSLRHAFAAHRLAHGEPVKDLQRLLGHAHLSTTMVYRRARTGASRS